MADALAPMEISPIRHTITGSSAQVTLIEQGGKAGAYVPVRICNTANATCYIAWGANPTATTSSMTIPGSGFTEVLRLRIPNSGPLLVAIIGTASSGVIEFMPGVSGV